MQKLLVSYLNVREINVELVSRVLALRPRVNSGFCNNDATLYDESIWDKRNIIQTIN
jgi:hypothetical protein